MKKIVCELCEGTEFTKEGGFFVCHGCGTKYSLAEAKSMMQEVEGDAAPVVGAASVAAVPMGNPNQAQIDNILVLATTAYEAQNYAEAENYCNRAIELDAMCYKAWNLKGKAVGWQSKIDNLRIEEAAHSFCKAIDFAPEEEKEELKTQASEELKKLGLALISLRKQRFSGSPDKEELNGFANDKKVLLSALLVLLSHGNAVGIPDGYLNEVATMMNDAAVAGLSMARRAWNKCEHPSEKDWDTYVGWCSNCQTLIQQAIDTCDDDDEADIPRYRNLITALEQPIDAKSYKQQWNSYLSRYEWVVEYTMADKAKTSRRNQVQQIRTKISELEKKVAEKKAAEAKKAAEEKAARIEAYWAAHADEKMALEEEKKQLSEKKEALDTEIAGLNSEISAARAEEKAPVPSEAETDRLKDQIRDLEKRRAGLGMFSGKEKKQITEEIATLQGRIDTLKGKIDGEKKAKAAEVQQKLAPTQEKRDALNSERTTVVKRISAIETELTKDPEE